MCVTSMVATDWQDRNPQWNVPFFFPNAPSREEFDELKKELESLKKLLKAAKLYDTETGQRDCEDTEKIALFKRLAELCDIDLSEVLGA